MWLIVIIIVMCNEILMCMIVIIMCISNIIINNENIE